LTQICSECLTDNAKTNAIESIFTTLLTSIVEPELAEILETIFLYTRLEAPLSTAEQENAKTEISAEIKRKIISEVISEIVTKLIESEKRTVEIRARLADTLSNQMLDRVMAHQLRGLMHSARREDAQLKMLLADDARMKLIDEYMSTYARPILTNQIVAERLAQATSSDIIQSEIQEEF